MAADLPKAEWVERIRIFIRSVRSNLSGRELNNFLLNWIGPYAALAVVPAVVLASFGVAAQAEGVLLDRSCAAVSVEVGATDGAVPTKYIWGEIDGEVHAIFRIGLDLTYAIPAEAFGEEGGVLTSAGGGALRADAIPSNAIPAEAIPSNAIPSNAIPSNAIPSNLLPSWVVAGAMPQVAAGGFLRLNDGGALSHTWTKDSRGVHMMFTLNGFPYELSPEQLKSAMATGAIPSNAIPSNAIPSNAIPSNAIPSNAIPSNLVYIEQGKAIPSNVVLNAIPAEAIPSNAIPAEAIPVEAIPSNAIPAEAIPSNFVSAIPSNIVVGMLSSSQIQRIPAESWANASALGIRDEQVSELAPQIAYQEMLDALSHEDRDRLDAGALPSSALPASALPASALPSSALPSSALPDAEMLPMVDQYAAKHQLPPDGLFPVVIDAGGPDPLREGLLRPFLERFQAGELDREVSTASGARDDCEELIREANDIGQNFDPSVHIEVGGNVWFTGSTGQALVPDAEETSGSISPRCAPDEFFLEGWGCYHPTTPIVTDVEDYDGDGDGYTPNQGDCRDDLVAVNPGAEEVRGDGLDNDCDGDVDEGTPGQEIGSVAGDSDGDGWLNDEDCQPSDQYVYPGADEIYGDGVDNDCDGEVDEGFLFDPGSEVIVAGGPPASDPDPPASDPDPPASDPDPPASDPDPPPPTETVSLSVEVFGPSAINSSMIVGGTEACSGPFSTEIDMWVDRRINGSPVPTYSGDVQSASMTWSGATSSGSPKGMGYVQQDVWSAQLGPFEDVSSGSIVVTGWITTSSGIQRSGTTSVTISNCMQESG